MARYVLGENAARQFKALVRGKGEIGNRPAHGAAVAFDAEYANPFTVQWAASVDGGSWIIWLPSADLVISDAGAIDPTAGLEEAGGDYPKGWYKLDGSALSKDTGGELWLNISWGDTKSARFTGSKEVGAEKSLAVPICKATVKQETGARWVRQFVTSAIVTGVASLEDQDFYDGDGHSITRMGHESTDPTQMWKSNYFHLHGFGYFTVPKMAQPIGTYHEASVLEIDPESTNASSVAFLVREGNSKEPDSNFLGYRKIKFGTGSRLSPFQYVEERRPAEEGEFGADEGASVLVSAKLVQCLFYWEGQLKQLPDFDVSGILGGGTVYLTGKQDGPSASSPNPEWTWAVATAEAQAPDGGKVLNFRLYEFAGQKVKVDYRTTFLSLEDTTQKAYYQLKTANGSAKITLDATGLHPKIEMEGEDGNKLSFFAGSSDFAFVLDHTTGTILEIPVDVDSTIKLKRRKLQVRDVSSDGNMAYGETLIDYGKIVLHGINIPPYIIFWSSGKYVASIQPSSSTNALYINCIDYGIVLNGKQNETKISTTPTATLENAANDLNIANLNWISSQLKQLMLDGDDTGVKILATNNVNIKQKKIAAGTGVKVTEKDGVITVSATGAITSGFTGSRTVLADTRYSGHYLQKRFYTETWKDGVLESSTLGNWITYHTAVEETA